MVFPPHTPGFDDGFLYRLVVDSEEGLRPHSDEMLYWNDIERICPGFDFRHGSQLDGIW